MIETTHKAFQFIPYQRRSGRVKDTSKAPTVLVSKKYKNITFNRACVEELKMQGQFIRFFYEPVKKIVAWKLDVKFSGDDNKGWKLVVVRKNGSVIFSIGSMIRDFNGSLTQDSYRLDVRKNVVTQGLMDKGDTYYYVEVK